MSKARGGLGFGTLPISVILFAALFLGEDVRLRLEMGTKVKATTYLRALSMRAKIIEGMSQVFRQQGVDALLSPTTPMAAPKIGEETTTIDGNGHATRGLLLRLNRPANLTGMPAISVPCGRTDEGLPVGLQLLGWGGVGGG